MADFDLASLLSSSKFGAEIFSDLATATTINTGKQNDITNLMVEQANQAKVAAENIAQIQGQAKMQTQQANLKVANSMGTNAQSSGWLIGQMGQRVIQADVAAQAKLADVQAKKSIEFIDNPIGYLYAQATVDNDIEEYNSYLAASDLAKDTASKLEQMSQASFLTQNAIEQSVTESTIASAKILEGFKYGAAANEAALQGLRTNLEGIQRAALATKEAINYKFQGANAIAQEKQYQLSLASHALARENFNLNKQAREEKLSEDSLIGKYIQKGFFNVTGGVELGEARKAELIRLYAGGRGDPRIVAMFQSGMESYMISPDGKQTVISTSPYVAAGMFNAGMPKNLPNSQMAVGEWLVKKKNEFNNPAVQNQLKIDTKDPKAVEAGFNEFVRKEAAEAAAVGADIYAPASLATVVATNKNLATLPVWSKVLAPMAAAGAKLDNPSVVMGAITTAITKGDISYNDAIDIVTLAQSGVDINNMSRNWISTGMPKGISQTVGVQNQDGLGTVPLTWTDQKEVATYFNKTLAKQFMRSRKPVFTQGN